MDSKRLLACTAAAGALALAVPFVMGQQAGSGGGPAAEEMMSDAGVIAPAPYDLEPRITLGSGHREKLRKLEDKHIGELRSLEDRYAKELRVLRAKQYAERDAMIKGFAAK